jgi:hypothetical protein
MVDWRPGISELKRAVLVRNLVAAMRSISVRPAD